MNIENKRQIIIILIAIGLGLTATGLTGKYIQDSLQKQTTALAKEYETQKIQPLLQEIQVLRGEIQNLQNQQATLATNLSQRQQEVQQQVQVQIPAMPITGLALRTPPGKRAFTIMIDSLAAVGGLISPGDYVDVLGHLNIPDPISGKQETVTAIVFQNIQIIAVGTNLQQVPGGYEQQAGARSLNVTFSLDPEQIGLVAFAQKNGSLQLVLRPPAESEIEMLQASTWNALANYVLEKQGTELVVPRLQANIEPLNTPAGEAKPYIQIFRGGKEL